MSTSKIHVTDSARILRFASTLTNVARAHPFKDGTIIDLYVAALDALEEDLVQCGREIAELCDRLEQEEDDDVRTKLQQQISGLERKKDQIESDKQQAAQAKRSYEEHSAELDQNFASDAERVATTLERFVKSLERAVDA